MIRVVKVGGAVCADPDIGQHLADAWKKDPGAWMIVHGGGIQITEALRQYGAPKRIEGLRVTSPAAAATTADVLDGVGHALAKQIQGVPVRHIASTEGRFHAVVKDAPAGLGRVGSVTQFVNPEPFHGITIVTPVGFDAHGPLNVNADEGALAVATAARANMLVLATDVPAVLDGNRQRISRMGTEEARALIADGVAVGGMVPKLRAALEALDSGVKDVRIGSLEALQDATRIAVEVVH